MQVYCPTIFLVPAVAELAPKCSRNGTKKLSSYAERPKTKMSRCTINDEVEEFSEEWRNYHRIFPKITANEHLSYVNKQFVT